MATALFARFGQATSRERVARVLWRLAARISAPDPVPPGARLKMPISHRLIGDATGLTPIHVDRVIRRLREQQIVALHAGAIVVEDPARLLAITNAGSRTAPYARPCSLRHSRGDAPDQARKALENTLGSA